MLGQIRRLVFGIPLREVTFARRGFRGADDGARQRLEEIGAAFVRGYHAALIDTSPVSLAARLNGVEAGLSGFAFEGAAMALALLDQLTPWRSSRLHAFLTGPGAAHKYMIHVGAGWAYARLKRRLKQPPAHSDPLLGWLVLDGYGFHEGYFHWPQSVTKQAVPKWLPGYARRSFDQGLGRSLWFVAGADAYRLSNTIAAFAPSRQADLWSGVGLACAYAGGARQATMEQVRDAGISYLPHIAQGAAFAAKARQHAGIPAPHTELACQVLCRLTSSQAARVTDVALENLPADGSEPAYEIWRRRIREQIENEGRRMKAESRTIAVGGRR